MNEGRWLFDSLIDKMKCVVTIMVMKLNCREEGNGGGESRWKEEARWRIHKGTDTDREALMCLWQWAESSRIGFAAVNKQHKQSYRSLAEFVWFTCDSEFAVQSPTPSIGPGDSSRFPSDRRYSKFSETRCTSARSQDAESKYFANRKGSKW